MKLVKLKGYGTFVFVENVIKDVGVCVRKV